MDVNGRLRPATSAATSTSRSSPTAGRRARARRRRRSRSSRAKPRRATAACTTRTRSSSFPGTSEVWMANPFCFAPTPHRVTAGGRTWTGTCAWDSLGIPGALHGDGEVESECACCGDSLALRVVERRARGGRRPPRPLPRSRAALVGRHRLHLKHDGLPPVGGAPRALARRERLGARRLALGAEAERARAARGGGRGSTRAGDRGRWRSRRRSSTRVGLTGEFWSLTSGSGFSLTPVSGLAAPRRVD